MAVDNDDVSCGISRNSVTNKREDRRAEGGRGEREGEGRGG